MSSQFTTHALHTVPKEAEAESTKWKLIEFTPFCVKANSKNSSLKYKNIGTNARITGLS